MPYDLKITPEQLRALWMWARVSVRPAVHAEIKLARTDDGGLDVAQGDRRARIAASGHVTDEV